MGERPSFPRSLSPPRIFLPRLPTSFPPFLESFHPASLFPHLLSSCVRTCDALRSLDACRARPLPPTFIPSPPFPLLAPRSSLSLPSFPSLLRICLSAPLRQSALCFPGTFCAISFPRAARRPLFDAVTLMRPLSPPNPQHAPRHRRLVRTPSLFPFAGSRSLVPPFRSFSFRLHSIIVLILSRLRQ